MTLQHFYQGDSGRLSCLGVLQKAGVIEYFLLAMSVTGQGVHRGPWLSLFSNF